MLAFANVLVSEKMSLVSLVMMLQCSEYLTLNFPIRRLAYLTFHPKRERELSLAVTFNSFP